MKVSTKGKYGLKAMIDIAVFGKDNCISIKSIAKRQHISESYLEQLIPPLKKAGFVKSVRGAGGGYIIAMDPSEIRLVVYLEPLKIRFLKTVVSKKHLLVRRKLVVAVLLKEFGKNFRQV